MLAAETVAEAAERYAACGWPVFPTRPRAKEPAVAWSTEATTDMDDVRALFAGRPEANVAVVTGHPSGLVVVDVDEGDALWRAQYQQGFLPDTATVATPRGWHLYFARPDAGAKTSAGQIAPGIDVRGDGGYVLAPPSVHPDGWYRWEWTGGPAELPPAWAEAVAHSGDAGAQPERPDPTIPGDGAATPTVNGHPWALAAFTREPERVRRAPRGNRNHTLNAAAYRLGRMVGGELLDESAVTVKLGEAARAAGLPHPEAEQTITSGLAAGKANPRQAPDMLARVDAHERAADRASIRPPARRKVLQAAQDECRSQGGGLFGLSTRQAALRAGCNRKTAAKHLAALQQEGWLQRVACGHRRHGWANRWRLTGPGVTLPGPHPHTSSKGSVGVDHPVSVPPPGHDLFRHGALASAWPTLRLLTAGGEAGTAASLAEALGVTPRTVWRHLRRLEYYGLAERDGDGWCATERAADSAYLDSLAERFGTAGRGERQGKQHERDRWCLYVYRKYGHHWHEPAFRRLPDGLYVHRPTGELFDVEGWLRSLVRWLSRFPGWTVADLEAREGANDA